LPRAVRELPPSDSPFFIVYIDESGDPGLNKVKPLDPNGASEWLTLGASLYHYEDEPTTVTFIREVRGLIKETQGPDLHFRRLSDRKKLIVCQQLSAQPTRGFAVLSHKPNMKGYRNQAAERLFTSPRGWFYNWCVRLLLERVTDYAERYMLRHYNETRPIKLVFSERGGIAYDWLKDYIEVLMIQSRSQTLYLPKRDVKHNVLSLDHIETIPHVKSAGCQIADIVTSAMHVAADARGSRWNVDPARALRPILPTEGGWHQDYSVTLQPSYFKTTRLTSHQRILFEEYGYCIRMME
jgi:hypothetical protein